MIKNIQLPDYDRSILSISSSIMKHYNVKSNYKSLKELDIILEKDYKHVVFLILDCLGMNIIEKHLKNNSIIKNNLITTVTSVYPPTTAAATTAFHSGLSPLENGWVGWMPYFKELNCMLELFTGKNYYTREKIINSVEKELLQYKPIYEKIHDKNKNIIYHKIFPSKVVPNGANTFEELCDGINKVCSLDEKNIVSAYWTEPDHTIHHNGINSNAVSTLVNNLDDNIKKLVSNLKDTLIIISADHGAVDVKDVYINEIKEIDECLKRPPSIESRTISFFIKKGMKIKFKNALKNHFKDSYILYTKNQFLKEGFLGKGKQHKRINDYLGDYIMVIYGDINIRYTINGEKDKEHFADHGGITKEEMIVPVIAIECNN